MGVLVETRVRISVGDVEVEAAGEEQFIVDRLPGLLSDLLGRLAHESEPAKAASPEDAAQPAPAKLASIAGHVRDYWSGTAVGGIQVTTLGLNPNLASRSDDAGRFVMSGRSTGNRCLLVTSALEAYAETVVPIELSVGPSTLSAVAVAKADINRQFASLGVSREPDSGVVILHLLDVKGAPLEMVSSADISLIAANGLVVGSGPYFFGAAGDLLTQTELPLSRAFDGRARAAFVNVPNGDLSVQVTAAVGPEHTLARVAVPIQARSGAIVLDAKFPA
jgi:hypothetical protein